MSRKHPSFEELEQKKKNIDVERAKVSLFEPVKDPKSKEVGWAKRTNPLPRLGQIPFEIIVRATKKYHDFRGPCINKNCAFKNSSEDDLVMRLAMQDSAVPV